MKKRNYLSVVIGKKERLLNVSEKTIVNLNDVIEEVSKTELENSIIMIYREKGGVKNVVEDTANSGRDNSNSIPDNRKTEGKKI
ncbi:hypothetical protein D0T84_05370 [Dysgonomonas sp. 521]|uniref:hypothetical protein n=1 Tax=Dysgonomonas sp. 521 TaxID=2302932 RepID=UPI0013D2DD7F|nr:hypothetical protein [Dysgonomonas sp. 521]NDV94348.1 hypothetical protein [Dysgonomonas sp. 521]